MTFRIAGMIGAIGAMAVVGLVSRMGFAEDAPATIQGAVPEDALPEDAGLSGRDIYERVLDNRFDTYRQETRMVSGDAGGSEQNSKIEMWYKNFRGEDDGKILSKTTSRYHEPNDMRHSGYLIINKKDETNDQFVYLSGLRRTRRINLESESVFGTDFAYEDVVPRELEDATYERKPDEYIDDTLCFVVEAIPTEESNSQYSRFKVYIEKEHYVPLQTLYWNEQGTLIKKLQSPKSAIAKFTGSGAYEGKNVWVPMKARMDNLIQGGYTDLSVEELEDNPELKKRKFGIRELESKGH